MKKIFPKRKDFFVPELPREKVESLESLIPIGFEPPIKNRMQKRHGFWHTCAKTYQHKQPSATVGASATKNHCIRIQRPHCPTLAHRHTKHHSMITIIVIAIAIVGFWLLFKSIDWFEKI